MGAWHRLYLRISLGRCRSPVWGSLAWYTLCIYAFVTVCLLLSHEACSTVFNLILIIKNDLKMPASACRDLFRLAHIWQSAKVPGSCLQSPILRRHHKDP
jgi:hypothetical protein